MHDMCGKSGCKCQKQSTFSTKDYNLEGCGFQDKSKKIPMEQKKTLEKILKLALKIASRYIGMAVSAKTKTPKIAQATTNI